MKIKYKIIKTKAANKENNKVVTTGTDKPSSCEIFEMNSERIKPDCSEVTGFEFVEEKVGKTGAERASEEFSIKDCDTPEVIDACEVVAAACKETIEADNSDGFVEDIKELLCELVWMEDN